MDVLIEAGDLHEMLERGDDVVLLDVRWRLDEPDGRPAYLRGHLPGAVYVDLERELAGAPAPERGRHPLPEISDLQQAARSWGVRSDSVVVVYDDNAGMSAARAWWLLRWGGHAHTWLLDGGLPAWVRSGLPLESGPVQPETGDVVLAAGGMPVVDVNDAADLARAGVLLDARSGERYRGEHEPVDPCAGHIPGARSAPTSENVGPDGMFRPASVLRDRFAALGVDDASPVGVYCGSGVTAAHEVAALAIGGFRAALYPGSWSQWCSAPDRPVATGTDPFG